MSAQGAWQQHAGRCLQPVAPAPCLFALAPLLTLAPLVSLSFFPHLCAVSQLHTRAGVTADVSISDDYGVHAAKFLAEQVWWPLSRDMGRAGVDGRKGQGPGGALVEV